MEITSSSYYAPYPYALPRPCIGLISVHSDLVAAFFFQMATETTPSRSAWLADVDPRLHDYFGSAEFHVGLQKLVAKLCSQSRLESSAAQLIAHILARYGDWMKFQWHYSTDGPISMRAYHLINCQRNKGGKLEAAVSSACRDYFDKFGMKFRFALKKDHPKEPPRNYYRNIEEVEKGAPDAYSAILGLQLPLPCRPSRPAPGRVLIGVQAALGAYLLEYIASVLLRAAIEAAQARTRIKAIVSSSTSDSQTSPEPVTKKPRNDGGSGAPLFGHPLTSNTIVEIGDVQSAIRSDSELASFVYHLRLVNEFHLTSLPPTTSIIPLSRFEPRYRGTEDYVKSYLRKHKAWFHHQGKVKSVLKSFLAGQLSSGHPAFYHHGVRPVAWCGPNWEPRFCERDGYSPKPEDLYEGLSEADCEYGILLSPFSIPLPHSSLPSFTNVVHCQH
jgi:hypothetical protein